MLKAFDGRINRKTYIIGNLIALGLLVVFTGLIVLPIAILGLAINNDVFDKITGYILYIVVFPALLYYFYFAVLMVKRAHDIGKPGLLIFFGVTLLFILARVFDFHLLNLLALLVVGLFCIKSGDNKRNSFGGRPSKKFKAENLKLHF